MGWWNSWNNINNNTNYKYIIMIIKFNEISIDFSEAEIIEFLKNNGFKIEEKLTAQYCIMSNGNTPDVNTKHNILIAIPLDEEYDSKKHNTIEITLKNVITSNFKKIILNKI